MRNKWRVIVAGGREFNDYLLLASTLDKLLRGKLMTHDIVIVSGKARGADSLGEKYAKACGFEVAEYPADWDKYGKSAGYKRNQKMGENSDCTVAFWDGQSVGTKHMIDITEKSGKPLRVVKTEGELHA